MIDEVRIYNRALGVQESFTYSTNGLIAHWDFNNGSGTTLLDRMLEIG